MKISSINYSGTELLAADVAPSKYIFCPNDVAKIISWQVNLADETIRDVFSSEIDASVNLKSLGSEFFFNAKSITSSGVEDINLETLKFNKISSSDDSIVFEPENVIDCACLPKVTYRLSELYFRAEISLRNTGTMPIYWRPEMRFLINLPWTDGIPFEKHIVKSLAKKRLRISDSYSVISSVKSSEKTLLDLLNEGAIGFNQLQDNKIWVGTSNEEEGLSFIFCNKSQRSTIVFKRLMCGNCLDVAMLSDVISEPDKKLTNPELQNNFPVMPDTEDVFAVEISLY